ncbi:hypothetical protein Ddc_08895 [Ditylenchus destructor]|nr:hypothetical protein Ddc_08895 [Ditylenchus destructor]
MANFLKKFVHAKSRSKSPVKQPSNVTGVEHEFEHHWIPQNPRYPQSGSNTVLASKQSPYTTHGGHSPRRSRTDQTGRPSSHRFSQRPPTPPSHYFTPDYSSPLLYEEPYQRVDSFTTVPNSPQSTRSILPFEKTNNHQSDGRLPSYHASNGTLLTARGWDGFPTLKGQLGDYKPNYSTEYMNGGPTTWATARTTHSGPGSMATDNHLYATNVAALPKYATNENLFTQATLSSLRPRSTSPRKMPKLEDEKKHRSKSPTKRPSSSKAPPGKTFDYLHAQCKLEGCSAIIIVEESRFLVCKHQLSHASDFFRTLFLNNRALPIEGVKQTSLNEYTIVVSAMRHPPQTIQFQWFLECTIPCPVLKDITSDTLETCMRLCKRFSAKGLEFRCSKYIQENVESVQPVMALCWLNWVFKHRFDRVTHDACLPTVARLPLTLLESHRQMLPEKVIVDLLAMKLRTCYQQTVKVFHSIHKLDHFFVDMERCPRCGRQREQGKVRIQANPCHKLIGCERCLRELGCEIEQKSQGDYQAFHQCDHGLLPFNDKTEDCYCQTGLYKLNWQSAHRPNVVENSSSEAVGSTSNQAHTLSSNPSIAGPPERNQTS